MKIFRVSIPLLVAVVFIADLARAETTVEGEIITVAGKLEVLRAVKTPGDFPAYSVILEGKTVIESDTQIKSIVAYYPENAPAKFLLVQIVSGGSGCPYSHRVMEVSENGKVLLSDDIESCFLMVGKPILKTDEWVIHFHPNKGPYTDTWIYRNGKVSNAPAFRIRVPK